MNWFSWLKRSKAESKAEPIQDVPADSVKVVYRDRFWKPVKESLGPMLARSGDLGYNRLGQGYSTRRDLSPVRHDEMQRRANLLWAKHPVAKKCLQNHRNFIAGQGFRATATSPNVEIRDAVQILLDQWWAINQWDSMLGKRVETLAVEGEWAYFCPPSLPNGHWKMAKILPEQIAEIIRCPLDAERLKTLKLREGLKFSFAGDEHCLESLDIVTNEWWTGRIGGNCLYLGINSLSGQSRGFSDLLAASDYLDIFDDTIVTEADRIKLQRSFAWRLHLKGSCDDERVMSRKSQIEEDGPPNPGEVLIHNDDEEWDTMSPTLNIAESIEFVRLLLNIILGGLHNPQHWFAEGGDVNKATSQEMGGPAFAVIRQRKQEITQFIRLALELALQRYRDCGALLAAPEDCTFEVSGRDPESSTYEVVGEILASIAGALQLGVQGGWMNNHEAALAYRNAATQLGLGDFPGVPDTQTLADAQSTVDTALAAKKVA